MNTSMNTFPCIGAGAVCVTDGKSNIAPELRRRIRRKGKVRERMWLKGWRVMGRSEGKEDLRGGGNEI
jgi:hypothetical protein